VPEGNQSRLHRIHEPRLHKSQSQES